MAFATECKSCGAPIWMAKTVADKWHPFDREDETEPEEPVDFVISEETSHFDTCPNANDWRKKKAK